MLIGYEVEGMHGLIPYPVDVKPGLRVLKRPNKGLFRIAQVQIGPIFNDSVSPFPNTQSTTNFLYGVRKRVGRAVPMMTDQLLRRFRNFVRLWIKHNVERADPYENVSVTHWLDENDSYPQWRKQEILAAAKEFDLLCGSDFVSKSFIKAESLEDFKAARIINARPDSFKAAIGPYVHIVEKKLFKLPYFVKHKPRSEFPKFVKMRLKRENVLYASTDWSAFESHVTRKMYYACEHQLYKWVLSPLPLGAKYTNLMLRVIGGPQRGQSRLGSFYIPDGGRMSGDMTTSIGNSFMNMMVNMFYFKLHGMTMDGIFEGDDGIMCFQASGQIPTEAQYREVGAILKLKVGTTLEQLDFCNLTCSDKNDQAICEPTRVLARFGWSHAQAKFGTDRVRRELLKAKALSLAFEYPSCPILTELAKCVLRKLKYVKARFEFDPYQTSRFRGLDSNWVPNYEPILPETRALFSRKYGISVSEQLECEKTFQNMDLLSNVTLPISFNPVWHKNYFLYTFSVPSGVHYKQLLIPHYL